MAIAQHFPNRTLRQVRSHGQKVLSKLVGQVAPPTPQRLRKPVAHLKVPIIPTIPTKPLPRSTPPAPVPVPEDTQPLPTMAPECGARTLDDELQVLLGLDEGDVSSESSGDTDALGLGVWTPTTLHDCGDDLSLEDLEAVALIVDESSGPLSPLALGGDGLEPGLTSLGTVPYTAGSLEPTVSASIFGSTGCPSQSAV